MHGCAGVSVSACSFCANVRVDHLLSFSPVYQSISFVTCRIAHQHLFHRIESTSKEGSTDEARTLWQMHCEFIPIDDAMSSTTSFGVLFSVPSHFMCVRVRHKCVCVLMCVFL